MVDDPTVGVNGGGGAGKGKVVQENKVVEKKVVDQTVGSKGGDAGGKEGSVSVEQKGNVMAAGAEDVGSVGMKKVRNELVVPEEPVTRYPEPNREELKKTIDEQNSIVKAAIARLDSTRGFYDERNKIREEGREEFQSAKKIMLDLSDQVRAKFDRRKSLSTQIGELRDNTGPGGGRSGGGKDGRDDFPPALKGCKSVEDVDARIAELEYQQATASLPIAEEKKLVADIAYLKHKGRTFIMDRERSFSAEKMARAQRIAKRKELEEIRKAEDKEIDELKAQLGKQRAIVDGIRQKQDKEIEALSEKFSDVDRDVEKKKINEARKEIKKVRDAYMAEVDKWRMNERIYREQQRIAKRKKWEAAQAEREARRLAWEAEMAKYPKPHPYQKEKDMCQNLINYLNGLIGVGQEKSMEILAPEKSDVPSLGKALPARDVTTSTKVGKIIGKGGAVDGDAGQTFGGFVKKSGKKGRKKGRRSDDGEKTASPQKTAGAAVDKSNAALPSHSMERFSAFTQLDIKPPLKKGEVSDAIEALKSKMAYYDSAPPPDEDEKKKAEEKPKTSAKSKSQKSTEYSGKLTKSEYPLMNGGGAQEKETVAEKMPEAVPEQQSEPAEENRGPTADKRPSFADIMAGKAKAPAPGPTATPAATQTQSAADVGDADIATGSTEAVTNNTTSEAQQADIGEDEASTRVDSGEISKPAIAAPTAASIVKAETTPAAAVAQK